MSDVNDEPPTPVSQLNEEAYDSEEGKERDESPIPLKQSKVLKKQDSIVTKLTSQPSWHLSQKHAKKKNNEEFSQF